MYLPARSWHWTSLGNGTSIHLSWAVSPAVLADIFLVVGRRREFELMGPAASFARPLPLWQWKRAEDTVNETASMCRALPWRSTDRANARCAAAAIQLGLERLYAQGPPQPKRISAAYYGTCTGNRSWRAQLREAQARAATERGTSTQASASQVPLQGIFEVIFTWIQTAASACLVVFLAFVVFSIYGEETTEKYLRRQRRERKRHNLTRLRQQQVEKKDQ